MRRAFSIDEVAEALGVSRMTVYRAMERGDIRFFYLGRRRLIASEELDRIVAGVS